MESIRAANPIRLQCLESRCDHTYAVAKSLVLHIRRSHPDNASFLIEEFKKNRKLTALQKRNTRLDEIAAKVGKIREKCPLCVSSFSCRDAFILHLTTYHPLQKDYYITNGLGPMARKRSLEPLSDRSPFKKGIGEGDQEIRALATEIPVQVSLSESVILTAKSEDPFSSPWETFLISFLQEDCDRSNLDEVLLSPEEANSQNAEEPYLF